MFVVWAKKNHCVGKSGAFRLVPGKHRERGKLDFAEAKSVVPESPTPLHNGWNVLRILALALKKNKTRSLPVYVGSLRALLFAHTVAQTKNN